MKRKPVITFDTNIMALREIRAFWGTICEMIGQRVVLTPTAVVEVLRRVRLETEREWAQRLSKVNSREGRRWSGKAIRRGAVAASVAARDWFREEMKKQGNIYGLTAMASESIEKRLDDLQEWMPDEAFDLTKDTGIRDRKIVMEALAWDFDILASNNIGSIDHELLEEWLEDKGRSLGIAGSILRPQKAESVLRRANDMPKEWIVHALVRSCVTDPEDPALSVQEMKAAMADFDERGMPGLRLRIERMTMDLDLMDRALESVRRHGPSQAMRQEAKMEAVEADAAARLSP